MFHGRACELKPSKRRKNGIKIRKIEENIHFFIVRICLLSPHPPSPRRRSSDSFVTPEACHLSRYRESLPHKDCFAIGGKVGGVIELRQHNDSSSAQGEVCIVFKRNEAEWLIFYFNTFLFHSLSYKRLF